MVVRRCNIRAGLENGEHVNPNQSAYFSYDLNGNRLSQNGTRYVYDDQDRQVRDTNADYEYDADGNQIKSFYPLFSQTWNETYDSFGRNTSQSWDYGTYNYTLDAYGRRTKRQSGSDIEQYIYDPNNRLVGHITISGNLQKFVYASKSHSPDLMIEGSDTYRIITDHLGSPRLLIKVSDNTILSKFRHGHFGTPSSPFDYNVDFPIGYAGGLWDWDVFFPTFGPRQYDSYSGRWVQKDPIGFLGGDANLYTYVGNDPMNFIDPVGLARLRLSRGDIATIAASTVTVGIAGNSIGGPTMGIATGVFAGIYSAIGIAVVNNEVGLFGKEPVVDVHIPFTEDENAKKNININVLCPRSGDSGLK